MQLPSLTALLIQIALVASALLPLEAAEALVIPHGADAPTGEKLTPAIRAWNRATLSGVIEKAGDQVAKAEVMTTLSLAERYWSHESVTLQEVVSAAKVAIDAGSDDPMMRYIVLRLGNPPNASLLTEYRDLYPRFVGAPYPAARSFFCAMRIVEALRNQTPRDEAAILAATLEAESRFMEAIAQADDDERGAVALYDTFKTLVIGDQYARRAGIGERLLKELSAPAIPPWWRDTLSGLVHIEMAWASRGNGWANTVTEDGWKGFGLHINSARLALVSAWKRHPDRPQAPEQMITVAMAGSREDGGEELWFNRTVAAQMDYIDAYISLSSALQPRWGGSYEKMFALGVVAGMTKRFDTETPWQFMHMVRSVYMDAVNMKVPPPDVIRTRPVYETCIEVINGYRALYPNKKFYYRSQLAITAYMCGFPKECLRQLDAAKAHVDSSCFAYIGWNEEMLRQNANFDVAQNERAGVIEEPFPDIDAADQVP